MFEFKEIKKTFKVDFWDPTFTVLNSLSFKVEEGTMCGFLGVNGAGKTTSLKILLNFIKPDSGIVEFSSKLGITNREIFSKIGFMPERPYFYPDLTGEEFLKYMGSLSKLNPKSCNENIARWTRELSIDYALNRKIKMYSKGMLQRLGFAVTLLHDPHLIILDEPMSGLDPVGRKEFKDIFKKLNNQGKTVFFSSHIVNDIEEICDHAVVIDKGNLFYSGKLNDLLEKNATDQYEVCYYDTKIEKNVTKIVIGYDESVQFIQSFLKNNNKLTSFVRKTMSLEEIIYKVRND